MACVAFLRGVNVGGHKAFQPSVLAKQMAAFDVVNVGAAGTFVVRKAISAAALRKELLRQLPFEAEVMICRARDLLELADGQSFGDAADAPEAKRFVSVLARRPRTMPRLPLSQPAGDDWQVKIVSACNCFVLSLYRRLGKRLIYPNEVVEKKLNVAATTRNWNTIATICEILKGG